MVLRRSPKVVVGKRLGGKIIRALRTARRDRQKYERRATSNVHLEKEAIKSIAKTTHVCLI